MGRLRNWAFCEGNCLIHPSCMWQAPRTRPDPLSLYSRTPYPHTPCGNLQTGGFESRATRVRVPGFEFCVFHFAFGGRGLGLSSLGSGFRISRFRLRVSSPRELWWDFELCVCVFAFSRLTGGVWVLAASGLDFELLVLEVAFFDFEFCVPVAPWNPSTGHVSKKLLSKCGPEITNLKKNTVPGLQTA